MKKENPHYIGHRARMKEKFIDAPSEGFSDYELIELLLFAAIPRKDVKPLAKDILGQFGSLGKLLHSDMKMVQSITGVNQNFAVQIKAMREMLGRVMAEEVFEKNAISSWSSLISYLKFHMANLTIEQFRVLFLNKKNLLIADEIMATGTIDQTPVYPREIVKKSLYHDAGSLILVHNHPSGSTKPSNADIDLTTEIVNACKTVNVTVHDHVIVGGNDYYSFKSNYLL